MDRTARERERITAQVGSSTVNDLFMQTAERFGPQPALVARTGDGTWRTTTWAAYRDRAAEVAMGLRSLGVDHGDFVALQAANRPEHVIADVGAMLAGATPVSVYNTLAPEQIAYVAGNCGATVAVLENAEFVERWRSIRDDLPDLEHLVVLDPDGVEGQDVMTWEDLLVRGRDALADDTGGFDNAWRAVGPDDPATVIYTSGTTGPPKGVVLTHGNLRWQMAALDLVLEPEQGLRLLSYLPLAHVAERMTTHYRAIQHAGVVWFVADVADLRDTLLRARPQALMAVPRVWEKMHAGLLAAIEAEEDDRKRKLALRALDVGRQVVRARQDGEEPGPWLRAQHVIFDKLVFSRIRERIGLDACEYRVSGAAPISADILEFFAAIGLELLEVYGMTESTAVITANRPGETRIGTVGQAVPGVELRIADDGEVLTRGPHVTPGYHGREEATAEAIDDEGWLHTGDLGEVDQDGYLRIIGRKKELIITAGGKNLSPNNIEAAIARQSPLIGQICAIGDERPFISALIVLDPESAPVWAEQHGIATTSLAELANHPDVQAEIARAVEAGNADLARVEQVKQWSILPSEWTAESEELTPTLKLKRPVIHRKYADVIDSMY